MSPEEEIKQIRDELFNVRFRMAVIQKDYPEETQMLENLQKELKAIRKKMAKLKVEEKEKEGNQRWKILKKTKD